MTLLHPTTVRSTTSALTRRALLCRSALLFGGLVMLESNDVGAQIPVMSSTTAVDPSAGREVRLEPVSPEIERVVVTAIAIDPRGELLAVAGDDHAIRILEMHSMRIREVLSEHTDLIRTLAFDKSGQRLASAGNDGKLIVWQRGESFEPQQRVQGSPALACVRFSPTSDTIAAVGFDRRVYLLSQAPNAPASLTCGCSDLRAVAFRDDNELMAVGGRSGELHLFNTKTGTLDKKVPLHTGRIRDLAFPPNSRDVVSVGEDGRVILYDSVAHVEKRRVELPSGRCFAVAVIDSQHVAVAGSDNEIRVINLDTGRVVRNLVGHIGSISTLASSGGVLYSGGYDATLRRWMVGSEVTGQERIAETEPRTVEKK